MTGVILHHYDFSNFAEKARLDAVRAKLSKQRSV